MTKANEKNVFTGMAQDSRNPPPKAQARPTPPPPPPKKS